MNKITPKPPTEAEPPLQELPALQEIHIEDLMNTIQHLVWSYGNPRLTLEDASNLSAHIFSLIVNTEPYGAEQAITPVSGEA